MSEVSGRAITKEMWKQIEEEMQGYIFHIVFNYKGHEVSVRRVHQSECKTCLEVYIDGYIKGEWVTFEHNYVGVSSKAPLILKDVWCKKTKSKYSPSMIKKLEKIWGKRGAKQRNPDLHEKLTFFVPNFSKASVLCRQYKKLEAIELVKAYFLKNEFSE